MSVIIIGGGVSGLSIGWILARNGVPVTLIERGKAGHEGATWASAGLLAPHILEVNEPNAEARSQLILTSHARWPEFAATLEDMSGMAIGYRRDGSLITATDEAGEARLRRHQALQQAWGIETKWLASCEAREIEPHLSAQITAAVFSERDHQVENRFVGQALRVAFERAGGRLIEGRAVDEIIIEGDQVRGVRASGEKFDAETVVLAAGAWSSNLMGLPSALQPPVHPVKGQILALQMPPDAPLITHILWGGGVYIIPRDSGRVVIGATVEDQGFDTQNTAGGVLRLLRGACETVPAFADMPIAEIWAGSRPGSADDTPILGETSVRGLIIATGHFAHGIVLAPITAHAISHLITTGETLDVIAGFGLARFDR